MMITRISEYLNIVLTLLSAVLAFYTLFFKLKAKFTVEIVKTIKKLEKDDTISGADKMEFLLSYILDLVPRFYKVVFNEKVINDIYQGIFEDMRKYSDNRVQNKLGMGINQAAKVLDTVKETQEEKKEDKNEPFNLDWFMDDDDDD